jgi:cytochrome c-type biogenesis protein
VVALAGVGGSLAGAAGLGAAYVFGMVAPLFVLAALWDRYSDRLAPLLRPRTFTWRLGPLRRTISGTGLATGVLLTLVGGGMIWTGAAGEAMPASSGWQAEVTLLLQRAGRVLTDTLAFVPNWAAAVALVVVLAAIVRTARRQLTGRHASTTEQPSGRTPATAPTGPSAMTDCCAVGADTEEDDRVPLEH